MWRAKSRAILPDLHVVYVNYRSAAELSDSIESVLADARRGPSVDITVVDNSCCVDEFDRLAACLPAAVEAVRSASNDGFAHACNLGAARGRAPYLLFLNPDTVVPPGTLARLHTELERYEGRALVGPRHFADEGMRYAHAPFRGARLLDEAWDQLWARGWFAGRSLSYLQQRSDLANREEPLAVRSISGGCLGVGRSTFDALGGWDSGYWLYGEDLEFCVRARRRGVPVLLLPDARIVHFMERSARQLADRAHASRVEGRVRFKNARYGRVSRSCERWAHRLANRCPRRGNPWHGIELWDRGAVTAPVRGKRWAVEIARSPLFDNCLTVFPSESIERPPVSMIDGLPAGEYFLRVASESRPGRWMEQRLLSFTVASAPAAVAPRASSSVDHRSHRPQPTLPPGLEHTEPA